jgi:hypothetical protein
MHELCLSLVWLGHWLRVSHRFAASYHIFINIYNHIYIYTYYVYIHIKLELFHLNVLYGVWTQGTKILVEPVQNLELSAFATKIMALYQLCLHLWNDNPIYNHLLKLANIPGNAKPAMIFSAALRNRFCNKCQWRPWNAGGTTSQVPLGAAKIQQVAVSPGRVADGWSWRWPFYLANV